MSANPGGPPRAVIFGCAGLELTAWERSFFSAADPVGIILFRRNVDSPEQVTTLVRRFRECVGRADALILVDQEGGRVARLGPPHWRSAPAAGRFAPLASRDLERARRATWLNSRLLADDLAPLGITVDCLPVLDLRLPAAHDIVGDRSYGEDPDIVAALGCAACEGLLAGGVLPVIKHIPGHGRAVADSHFELPVVPADRETLEATDFRPFRALADMPMAMTAHILYSAIDDQLPATLSATVLADVVRGSIGFEGLLMSDDLSMKALGGDVGDRASAALEAGCDVVLHCNGDAAEMERIAAAARPLDAPGASRLARAIELVHGPAPFNRAAALTELDDLLGPVGAQG